MTHYDPRPIALLGAGSWGTALALHLAKNGQHVILWSANKNHVAEMAAQRSNKRYLPSHVFPPTLTVTHQLHEALAANDIIITLPSHAFRALLLQLQPLLSPTARIAWGTKGLDLETGNFLHHVVTSIFGAGQVLAVIAGPSFAKEVAAGLPTAMVVASNNPAFAHDLTLRFNHRAMRIYSSHDITSVELGGVVKNVLAIALGISDGMGYGANARCALITRGLAEMVRLGLALGCQESTLYGLTGLGDLILTCTDNQSRNRRLGLAIGQGQAVIAAEQAIGQVVEGKQNAELVMQLADNHAIDMPICAIVVAIIRHEITPHEAMQKLLARTPTTEKHKPR